MASWCASNWRVTRLTGLLALAAALLLQPAWILAQVGSTTDVIVGHVVGPDTMPLRGAHIDITSLESGITRTKATGDDGRFSIVFPDGGGQYVVTVHYLGMAPVRTLVRRQADEDRLVADFRLVPSAVRLSAVNVEAQRAADSLAAGAGAIGEVLSRELLDRLGYQGNEAAALALITPGVTLLAGADSSMSALSIGGQAPSQTGHLVDGMQAGSASLPREAVKSTSVITSAYDVSNGQYTGGFFEQTTVSGTNMVKGTLTSATPLAPVGDLSERMGYLSQRRTGFDGGGNIAGPFRKDHLFGSFAAHGGRNSLPGASVYTLNPATLARLGLSPDSLGRFLQILNAQGIPTPTGDLAGIRAFGNRQLFGRIDFTPSEKHTLTLSGNEYKYWNSGAFNGPLSTPLAAASYSTEAWRGLLSLTSHLGAWVNDARVSGSQGTNGVTALFPAASGRVVIPSAQPEGAETSGIATLSFGGNNFASQVTTSSNIDAKDELSWLSDDGAHRVKLGAGMTFARNTGGVPGNRYGTYTFNSLNDLQNNTPASFSRTLAPTDRASASTDAALYVGDAWRTGPKLQLVYGLRLEHTSFADAPRFNADAATAFGIHTNAFPQETRLSPRLGFTYFYGATDKKPASVTIRGGIGLFRGGASQVSSVFAAARDATGLADSQAQLTCVGSAVPPLDWNYFQSATADLPVECAGGLPGITTSPLPNIIAIDPSFQVPRTLRASLNISRQFAKVWNVSLDGSFSNGYAGIASRDLNLLARPQFLLADEGNRPVYVNPGSIIASTGAIALRDSRVVPEFGTVSVISSPLRNDYRSVSLSLGRMLPSLSINGSYTRSFARMQMVGSSTPGVLFGNGASTGGDPRATEWAQNPYAPPHQLRVFMSYRPTKWMEITPSVFAQSGYTFDALVSGDINGDGSENDRAFVFDPAKTADTAIANGMRRLLAAAPTRIRDCLNADLGKVASAGTCRTPWFVIGGMSFKVTPPWNGGRLSLSLQTNNLGGGLDLLLHGESHLHGWGSFPATDQTLLYVRGFDAASQSFKYAVNERFGVPTANHTYYRQPMQMTLVAQMALGRMQGGGMGGMSPMDAPAHAGVASGAAGATHADTLRSKIAATMPNVFRRALALNDSLKLALDTAQMTRLKVLGDAYQPRADSLTSAIIAIMSAPVAGADPTALAMRVRVKSDEANVLVKDAIADLRKVLRPEQVEKLPDGIIK
jgi:hypothetical protein